MATRTIDSIVRTALKKRFPKMRIVNVLSENTFDHDGDPIIEIRVVFDDRKSEFVPGRLIEIPGMIIPELEKIGASAFPILSYVAKSDLEAASPEAA